MSVHSSHARGNYSNVIEIEMNKSVNFSIYKNVPNVMIPAFWFAQTVELDEKLAKDAKVGRLLIQLKQSQY